LFVPLVHPGESVQATQTQRPTPPSGTLSGAVSSDARQQRAAAWYASGARGAAWLAPQVSYQGLYGARRGTRCRRSSAPVQRQPWVHPQPRPKLRENLGWPVRCRARTSVGPVRQPSTTQALLPWRGQNRCRRIQTPPDVRPPGTAIPALEAALRSAMEGTFGSWSSTGRIQRDGGCGRWHELAAVPAATGARIRARTHAARPHPQVDISKALDVGLKRVLYRHKL